MMGGSALGRAITRSLNLKSGLSEMFGWSDEAQDVIDEYNRLLAEHDKLVANGIAAASPALNTRFTALKGDMQVLETTRVANTPKDRKDHQDRINNKIEAAKELVTDLEEEQLRQKHSGAIDRRTDEIDGDAAATVDYVTGDGEEKLALRLDGEKMRALFARMPRSQDSVDALDAIEDRMFANSGSVSRTVHDAVFRAQTEMLESVIGDTLAASENPKLAALKDVAPGNYWKLLIDGKEHAGGDKHAYASSQGYMASMMKGLQKIVSEVDRPISVDFLKELHASASKYVITGSKPDDKTFPQAQFQEQGLKRTPNSWGVTKQFSPDGVHELEALRRKLEEAVPDYFTRQPDANLGGVMVPQVGAGQKKPPSEIPDLSTLSMEEQIAAAKRINDHMAAQLQAEVEQLVTAAIASFYETVAAAEGGDAKIGACIDCCRMLGQIHPFKDANGRVMMFLMLNKLLMEQGLSPTVLQDQGFMIGKSKAELIAAIKEGQASVAGM